MRLRVLLLSVAMTGFAAWSSAATDWTVYLRRSGPLRIGMSLSEVRRVLRDPQARIQNEVNPSDLSCAYLVSARLPENLGVMFLRGHVARFDVIDPGIRTASGAEVGNTEAMIERLYPGRIKVEPHHYLPEVGHYLYFLPEDPTDRNLGMILETDGKQVTSFRAGTREAISLVEGCL